ncbi:helix-turn-helix domain-containing protein [Mixta mediterraneensis]|uniref:helix-turn-helix domain-containing protein n=1 Tax=Mixta mediterraneensis TaxID=2758443 RepID=UPI001876137E|nr:helix-turn-helix transcriptional regulator [Mixta mediterraneensis]MBE5251747.1 helix-turn-helix transcriptional regulator [Mixta mediterraneensis]
MRLIKEYSPPTTDDLIRLKDELGYTGNQMADLAGVASNSQWRKYTGGESPRDMSPHILFFMAAQLALSEEDLNKVLKKMQHIGAEIK